MAANSDSVISPDEAAALFRDLERYPALLLAVSGGPDSTALMLLAARWLAALERGPKLIAATVDHGLRPESEAEARAVAALARKLGVAHRTLRWAGKKPATRLQEAARAARYALLAEAAKRVGAQAILTAHTLDDQAETVLIRLTRGSGIAGLAAMRRVSPLPSLGRTPSPLAGEGWGGGYTDSQLKLPPSRIASRSDLPRKGGGEEESPSRTQRLLLRPLLSVPKSRLIATLRAANIPFAEDPSNRDPRFTRARLRALMPKLGEEGLDVHRLARLAGRLARADEALNSAADEAYRTLAKDAGGRIEFDAVEVLARLPAEIALRLLGRSIGNIGDEGPVELGKLEALHAALKEASGGRARFRRSLAGALVTLNGPSLTVERAPPRRSRRLTTAASGRRKSRKKR